MFSQSMYFRVSVVLNVVQDDKILWVNCYIISYIYQWCDGIFSHVRRESGSGAKNLCRRCDSANSLIREIRHVRREFSY